jgi:hypothetical protein
MDVCGGVVIDEKVEEFLKWPIEHPISYLFVDAAISK